MNENKCIGCESIEYGDCVVGTDCKHYSEENIHREAVARTNKEINRLRAKIDKLTAEKNKMVEVVRCKDCKHSEDPNGEWLQRYCNYHEFFPNDDDYCSHGEEREEE